jgi:hypothetical protein
MSFSLNEYNENTKKILASLAKKIGNDQIDLFKKAANDIGKAAPKVNKITKKINKSFGVDNG